ncbi:DUF2764 family protein [Methylobacter sp.]|uniref:DUF2764 family protein n=1 Tax=Methylobacter sp. TaxID=2051955 RepID=UPI003DA34BC1
MKDYYTVVASLPHLPYFADAERLPLTRLRLEQRLRMLNEDETRQIYLAERLVGWRPSATKFVSGAKAVERINRSLQDISDSVLREFVEYRLDMQTLIAALRIRQSQRSAPSAGTWGMGGYVKRIEANWDAPDFRLSHVYPWLLEADSLIAAANAVALDRLLMDVVWRHLSRLADTNPFGFEPIVAYVFQWDILQAWLLRDTDAAKHHFKKLIDEVKHVQ